MKKIVTALMALAAFGLLCGAAFADDMKSAPAQMMDSAKGAAAQAEGKMGEAKDMMMDKAEGAMDEAKDKMMDKAEGAMDEAKDKMMDKPKM